MKLFIFLIAILPAFASAEVTYLNDVSLKLGSYYVMNNGHHYNGNMELSDSLTCDSPNKSATGHFAIELNAIEYRHKRLTVRANAELQHDSCLLQKDLTIIDKAGVNVVFKWSFK